MRQEKRVWWSFSAWEADLFERYLEDQALQGWFPEKIGNFGIKFCYGKPEKRSYATVLVPGSSTLTGADSWAEKKFQERCEDAGWKFQCRGMNWQVFYATDRTAVKRTEEMNEARQFEIQKSLVWGWSTRILYPILIVLNCWILYRSLQNPGVVLADPLNFLSVIVTTMIMVSWGMLYVRLVLWVHRKKKILKRSGEQSTSPEKLTATEVNRRLKWRKIGQATWIFLIFIVLSALCAVSLPVFISGMVSMFVMLGIVLFMQRWIRENGSGNSREDWIGYFVGVVVISMIAFPLCNAMVGHFMRVEEKSQTETYSNNSNDSSNSSNLSNLSNSRNLNEKHTVFASYQTSDMRVNGVGNPVGVTIFKSPIPWVISQTKKNYPKDMTDLWEQSEQELPETEIFLNLPENVQVIWCRYTIRKEEATAVDVEVQDGLTESQIENENIEDEAVAVDEVVLSDKNRLVILDFGGGTDDAGLEEAVKAFVDSANQKTLDEQ